MKAYSSYLFDSDGTLIDTVELIYQSFNYATQKYGGFSINRTDLIPLIGIPLKAQFEQFLGKMPEDELSEILLDYKNYQLEIYPAYLRPFPDVKETLAGLKRCGKKLAVVTSRKAETANLFLEVCGFFEYFDAIITPEMTDDHKPKPAPALKALEVMKMGINGAIMIGDSSWDMECGINAGIDTAFVTWSHVQPEDLSVTPTHFIHHMADLLN